ncbi:EF-hand domain-containing protein [archaeon]|nr:MAG: EF-hand domain-containing protein [archaeon]
MGQKFVTVLREPDVVIDVLREMTIVDVRAKASEMNKLFRGQPLYFLGRKELQKVFRFNDRQIMECIKVFSVHKTVIRIGCVDFWGALALASSGASDEKIGFCFKLMDANRDDYLSTNEVVILLICITRGLARLKGFDVIPEEILDSVVLTAFQNERKKLNSHGEISMNAFIGFCLANDITRGYLASIGAKVPPVDAQALVLKRSHALKQLAEVQFRIDETLHQIEEVYAQSSAMDNREGDLPFLKLFEGSVKGSQDDNGSLQQTNNSTIQSSASLLIKPSMKRIPSHTFSHTNSILGSLPPESSTYVSTHDSDEVSVMSTYQSDTDMLLALPASHPVKRYLLEEDTWKNEVYRIKKASAISVGGGVTTLPDDELFRYIFTKQFEADLYKQWRKLPHDEDDLALVDELTLVALFQQCNVVISFAFARACLLAIVPSQCKKFVFRDVLGFFRHHCFVYQQCSRRQCYHWYRIISAAHDQYKSWGRSYCQLMDLMILQRKVLTGLVRVEDLNVAKKLADFRNLITSTPSVIQYKHIINAERIRSVRKRSQTPGIKPNTPANNEDDNSTGSFPVRLQFNMSTVPFTNISTKRPRDSSRLRILNHPDGSAELTVFDMGALQATDILDYYNLQSEKKFYEEDDRRRRQEAAQGKIYFALFY